MEAPTDRPADLRALLADAPALERSLLELDATWRSLPEAHARVAARLRVFALNWNPLGWMGGPFEVRATATGDGDTFELVLYVPLPDLVGIRDAAGLLGDLSRSVVDVGVEQELLLASGAYAQLAHAGKVPGLLSATGGLTAIEPPLFAPATAGWEAIGLGAIQDLVQAELGPVDLDRSLVRLDPAADPAPGCPACAGQRFGFPAELLDAQAAMCDPHAERAGEIAATRLERADASNPEGWRAIADASSALSEPTHGLPLELLDRLEQAVDRITDTEATPEILQADAEAALELADRMRGQAAAFGDWVESFMAADWMLQLPWDLARRGLVDPATQVADAFAELDAANRSMYANDAAMMLAEAGRADEARARVEVNLREYPADVWTHVHAGDVHRSLADPDRAEQAFRRASALAQAGGEATRSWPPRSAWPTCSPRSPGESRTRPTPHRRPGASSPPRRSDSASRRGPGATSHARAAVDASPRSAAGRRQAVRSGWTSDAGRVHRGSGGRGAASSPGTGHGCPPGGRRRARATEHRRHLAGAEPVHRTGRVRPPPPVPSRRDA